MSLKTKIRTSKSEKHAGAQLEVQAAEDRSGEGPGSSAMDSAGAPHMNCL